VVAPRVAFSDPTTETVLHDDIATQGRETATSEGIGLSMAIGADLVEAPRTTWTTCNSAPHTTERFRPVAGALKQGLALIPDRIP
jgi:hypothetical protein